MKKAFIYLVAIAAAFIALPCVASDAEITPGEQYTFGFLDAFNDINGEVNARHHTVTSVAGGFQSCSDPRKTTIALGINSDGTVYCNILTVGSTGVVDSPEQSVLRLKFAAGFNMEYSAGYCAGIASGLPKDGGWPPCAGNSVECEPEESCVHTSDCHSGDGIRNCSVLNGGRQADCYVDGQWHH